MRRRLLGFGLATGKQVDAAAFAALFSLSQISLGLCLCLCLCPCLPASLTHTHTLSCVPAPSTVLRRPRLLLTHAGCACCG